MEDIRIFIRNMLQSVFKVKVQNPEDISYPIISAVGSVEDAIDRIKKVDEEKISKPIVDAQNATTEAIKAIPAVQIPEVNFTSLEEKIDALKTALEAKEMKVNVGETNVNVDTKSVVEAIKKLEKCIKEQPKIEQKEVSDYTEILSKMCEMMEKPEDHMEIKKVQELIKKLDKTDELSIIAEWLKIIAEKEEEQPDFKFNKDGRLKVEVDRAGGGGGGGLTSVESLAIQASATEATLSDLNGKIPLTAFGEILTAELTPIFQGSFEYTVDNTELTETSAVSPATVTQANAMAVVTTSTTTGKKVSLKSHVHTKYKAGLGGLAKFTALFSSGVTGTFQWFGIMDELGSTASFKNGYAIGYNGTNLCVARFQNDTLNAVNRADWDDPLDGTGASGMTIDPTKLNVFYIRFQYLGAGAITFHVEDDATGRLIEFHRILYANNNVVPSTYNPNFHFFMFADNGATTSNIVVKSASYAYFVEGKVEYSELHQPQFGSGTKQKTTVTSEVAIFTIKAKDTYASKTNFVPILLEHLGASVEASSANNLGTVRLVKNATLGGTPSFADINTTDSVCSIDTAGTTVTGGKDLLSFQLAGKNDKINERVLDLKFILQDGDTITLAASSANSATFNGNLLWKELF